MSRKRQQLSQKIIAASIEKFSHDGRGIARIDGKTTFIAGALPGEEVLFQYTRSKKDFDEGRVTEVLTRSAHRADPRCQHYALCGGCSLQHLDEETQIYEKEALLLDLLERIGHCRPEKIMPPLMSQSWNYRNKARLSVRFVEKKNATLVGFREKNNPRYITEITHCPVLHEKVDGNILAIRSLLDSLEVPGNIAQIEVAAGDTDVALIFRNLEALAAKDAEMLKEFAQRSGFVIFLQPGNAETVTRFYPSAPDDFLEYSLTEEQITFKFHPTDFTQVNAALNQAMIARALSLLDLKKDEVVLDLFCGLGNFSLPMAKRALQVIGVEGSDVMVKRAAMNARNNNIDNAQFYCADLDKPSALDSFHLPLIDKLLMDPPRSGALEIVRQIDKLKPRRVVYVSCNPATLARDSEVLVNTHGYRLKVAGVMDMFPHTAHVESIALFEKER